MMKYGGAILAGSVVFNIILQSTGEDIGELSMNSKWKAKERAYRKSQNMDPIGLGMRSVWTPEYLTKKE